MNDKPQKVYPGRVGLLDLAPDFELVEIYKGETRPVYGWTVDNIFSVLKRWPDLAQLFTGGILTMKQVVDIAPGSMAALIAMAMGHANDEQAEFIAGRLPVQKQAEILQKATALTFTDGFGPFVQMLVDAGLVFDRRIKEPFSNSPPTSSTSPADTENLTFGE